MRKEIPVGIKLLDKDFIPVYKHDDDSCADCKANVSDVGIKIPPKSRCLVGLGFCLDIPNGYEVQVRSRSGLSKTGIDVALGTVDENYKGEIKACVINNTEAPFPVERGDRICQIKISETPKMTFRITDELQDSSRGAEGFGSTGIK